MIFALPWAFLGLAALPALAAIYLLRSRSRNRPVSSLMLWAEATRPHAGGRLLKRLHVPLILILELATLALLVLAATGPHWPMQAGRPPLAVVLDDSFSMQAGGDASPRAAAEEHLRDLLRGEPDTAVRFVLAGAEPLTLGVRGRGLARLEEAMDRWTCRSPAADLETAVTHALSEVWTRSGEGGSRERVLVLADHKPASDLAAAGVLWRAFGQDRPNAAVVHAARSRGPDDPRCLVEVANFAADARPLTLTIERVPEPDAGAAATPAARPAATVQRVTLGAGERRALVIELPRDTGAVRARLDADALPLDDQVLLLPDDRPPVRVDLRVAHEPLRAALRRALEATGRARLTERDADLVITDGPPPAGLTPERWSVSFAIDEKPEAFIGPFITDRTHPLCEGLDLESVIWAAAREPPMPGTPVVSAGNVTLVTDTGRAGGRRDIRIRMTPDFSNLTQSTNWPALVWNLLAYRSAHLPGLHTPNVRLGEMVLVPVPTGIAAVEVRAPDGSAESRTVHDGRVALHATLCGRYNVTGDTWTQRLAANALAPDESDLRGAETGVWGAWDDAADAGTMSRPVAWLAMLLAAGLLAAHLALVGRSQGEQTL